MPTDDMSIHKFSPAWVPINDNRVQDTYDTFCPCLVGPKDVCSVKKRKLQLEIGTLCRCLFLYPKFFCPVSPFSPRNRGLLHATLGSTKRGRVNDFSREDRLSAPRVALQPRQRWQAPRSPRGHPDPGPGQGPLRRVKPAGPRPARRPFPGPAPSVRGPSTPSGPTSPARGSASGSRAGPETTGGLARDVRGPPRVGLHRRPAAPRPAAGLDPGLWRRGEAWSGTVATRPGRRACEASDAPPRGFTVSAPGDHPAPRAPRPGRPGRLPTAPAPPGRPAPPRPRGRRPRLGRPARPAGRRRRRRRRRRCRRGGRRRPRAAAVAAHSPSAAVAAARPRPPPRPADAPPAPSTPAAAAGPTAGARRPLGGRPFPRMTRRRAGLETRPLDNRGDPRPGRGPRRPGAPARRPAPGPAGGSQGRGVARGEPQRAGETPAEPRTTQGPRGAAPPRAAETPFHLVSRLGPPRLPLPVDGHPGPPTRPQPRKRPRRPVHPPRPARLRVPVPDEGSPGRHVGSVP